MAAFWRAVTRVAIAVVELPLFDAGAIARPVGASGATVSTVIVSTRDVAETFPAASRAVTVISRTPSASAPVTRYRERPRTISSGRCGACRTPVHEQFDGCPPLGLPRERRMRDRGHTVRVRRTGVGERIQAWRLRPCGDSESITIAAFAESEPGAPASGSVVIAPSPCALTRGSTRQRSATAVREPG